MDVPASLRRWFVIHFAVDLAFAVPLILVPAYTMHLLGWTTVEPVATRLVGAALAAIGLQSLLGRHHSVEAFRTMLGLKCLWSGVAIVGLALSLAEGAPPFAWALLGIFIAFAMVWNYYRLRLRPRHPAAARQRVW